jgi:hypothetical protein
MGLSLVGVGLININTSEGENGYAGEYNCDSLKDQSALLWTGVGVLVLTSIGLMASFWPDSRLDESSSDQPPPHAPNRRRIWHCCRRNAKSPIYGAIVEDCENDMVSNVDDMDDCENDTVTTIMDDCENDTVTSVDERGESTSRQRGTSRLLKLAGNQSVYLWIGIAVLLVRLPFSLAIPHFVSATIASLINEDFIGARREILLLFLLGTVDAVLDFWCVFLFGKAKENIVRAVRVDTFSSIMRQDATFFDTTNTGDLISRLTSDCGEMAQDLTW